jgi:hypothetical protein
MTTTAERSAFSQKNEWRRSCTRQANDRAVLTK